MTEKTALARKVGGVSAEPASPAGFCDIYSDKFHYKICAIVGIISKIS
jgi:hypothetical protein